MAQILLLSLGWFLFPILLFCLFWKFGRPFWSLALYLPLLGGSVVYNVFLIGPWRGLWRTARNFWYSDGVIWVPVCWLPGLAGLGLILLVYALCRARKK